ncbi:hypothetical protein [uncultured Sphingomonas sp.]|uniref:hypothetical protein n=1 Tax=uncultured Sphingomonas sp. TaxID=158754 RepID=UPI0025D42C85|nr:hypothetical protein [uncultured Sphingomonas sp.]
MQETSDTTTRDRMAALLDRHPNLSPPELSEVIDFLARGPIVDRGMLRGDPAYAATIEAIQAEHKSHFRAGFLPTLAVIALITVPLAVMLWVAVRYG